ncbi:MAG: hypothetical protein ACOYN8_06805 [Pseudanabaena sp.]
MERSLFVRMDRRSLFDFLRGRSLFDLFLEGRSIMGIGLLLKVLPRL